MSHSEDVADPRQFKVAQDLSAMLDRLLRNHRTHDGKELTDGDVIIAIGLLVGGHVRTAPKVTKWMNEITIAALAALPKETT